MYCTEMIIYYHFFIFHITKKQKDEKLLRKMSGVANNGQYFCKIKCNTSIIIYSIDSKSLSIATYL